MFPHKKDSIWICPSCGHENNLGTDAGIDRVSNSESVLCNNCRRSYDYNKMFCSLDSEKTSGWTFKLRFLLSVVFLSILVTYLNRTFGIFNSKNNIEEIVYEILIVLVVSSTLASGRIWQKLKYLAIWAGIFLVLMIGYSYRYELAAVKNKVLAGLFPAEGFQKSPYSMSFPVSSDGHFHIRAKVNGIPIMFLVDTGASNIVLSPSDAERLGIKVNELNFNRIYETANGNVRGSSIQLADFRIGDIHLEHIGASVNGAEMRESLLGMTFFRRLKGYDVKNDVLTLYWKGK
jgi:aspartyl protease family protein